MSRRSERINGILRAEISRLLLREIKDPRLTGIVSITQVVVSMDLKHAKVFVSIMGTEETKKEVMAGFRSATGFLRKELREHLELRFIPELSFHRDDSLEQGDRILRLLGEIPYTNVPQ